MRAGAVEPPQDQSNRCSRRNRGSFLNAQLAEVHRRRLTGWYRQLPSCRPFLAAANTDFGALGRFYRKYRKRPFAITEFGVWGEDAPAFVSRLMRWVAGHRRTRMLVYYQDFGRRNAFQIQGHPDSRGALADALDSIRFPSAPARS
jgi:hypothetical protein